MTADGNQLWDQDTPGVPGNHEYRDLFGSVLAAGDFDGDGADDLAIGAPGEDAARPQDHGAGAVTVLHGSINGLSASRAERWTQDSPGVQSEAQPGESFGISLASGQFGGSTQDDLAIGVPGERQPGVRHAGLVNVLYGHVGGLDGAGAQAWSQALLGISDAPKNDHFGTVLGP